MVESYYIWEKIHPINEIEEYPLVNVHITMENHHAINGKIPYFYGHFQ